ncbi:hypothetical protein X975_05700, partial [Stegodyphus mimosarum]
MYPKEENTLRKLQNFEEHGSEISPTATACKISPGLRGRSLS